MITWRDKEYSRVPIVPLRDTVLLPKSVVPVLIGRDRSLAAVEYARANETPVLFVLQNDGEMEDPGSGDLREIGVLGGIEQVLPAEDGLQRILVNLERRVQLLALDQEKPFLRGEVVDAPFTGEIDDATELRTANIVLAFRKLVNESKILPPEILFSLEQLSEADEKLFFVIGYLLESEEEKQNLLELPGLDEIIIQLEAELEKRKEFKHLKEQLDESTQQRIMENQKTYFLHEQMRIIQEELEQEGEEGDAEFARLLDEINSAGMPEEVHAKAMEEFSKLKKSPPMSPENHVIRNYLDWLVQVPWNKRSDDNLDLDIASAILDADHYGLEKPKERILEYLAVMNLTRKTPGMILCLVGPPGVGKTSLAQSIARALGRKFLRISLGGVRDEAEVRGHRRTYIGAMPGKIIQSMKRGGVVNPLILLDEIDKMTLDFHGDPASALLEVLDPEQNKTFVDHYLDVDYDLSEVMFITTANFARQIPEPLFDRLEVIDLPGYLEIEKVEIARRHLLPKQLERNGLSDFGLQITDQTLSKIINEYSREAGVRNLERNLAQICRRLAVRKVRQKVGESSRVSPANLVKYLGQPRFIQKTAGPAFFGRATGLAWTQSGGDVLTLEVNRVPGKERFVLTGKLGEVMQESAQAALAYIKANTAAFGIAPEAYKDQELHLHIPEGAVPKDGPSAGITIATALLSELLHKNVPDNLAMTGEITIKGEVLPIGGLNEKIMAARRFGIKRIIIPEKNRHDLDEVKKAVKQGIEFIPVQQYNEIYQQLFAGG
jgi:ATP-dependent Lon protease